MFLFTHGDSYTTALKWMLILGVRGVWGPHWNVYTCVATLHNINMNRFNKWQDTFLQPLALGEIDQNTDCTLLRKCQVCVMLKCNGLQLQYNRQSGDVWTYLQIRYFKFPMTDSYVNNIMCFYFYSPPEGLRRGKSASELQRKGGVGLPGQQSTGWTSEVTMVYSSDWSMRSCLSTLVWLVSLISPARNISSTTV